MLTAMVEVAVERIVRWTTSERVSSSLNVTDAGSMVAPALPRCVMGTLLAANGLLDGACGSLVSSPHADRAANRSAAAQTRPTLRSGCMAAS